MNSIPHTLQELLVELNFIGKITIDMKPCMNDKSLVHSNSWLGAIKRYINKEGRIPTMAKINNIIDRTIAALEQYRNNPKLYPLILAALQEAKNGIDNLRETYSEDIGMQAKLAVCLENIKLQLPEKFEPEIVEPNV